MDPLTLVELLIAFAGFVVVTIGGVIARDRALQRMIREGDERVSSEAAAGRKHLHERLDDSKRELGDRFDALAHTINRDFVRREDIRAVQDSINALSSKVDQAQQGTNRRLDELLHTLAQPKD